MPVHDWSRVRANRFHDFHQSWTIRIRDALNGGVLPEPYLALAEQITGGPEPDVVTLSMPTKPGDGIDGGVGVAEAPPKVRVRTQSDTSIYARKANRITVRHPDGQVVAVIEIISPGNKDSAHAIKSFARKAVEFLHAGIHLLIVDLFPPSKRDPQGIHKVIWDRIRDEPYELPAGKPFTLAAYTSGSAITAYVENVGVGDDLPDMPIFLTEGHYVRCPLETTYGESWAVFPKALKGPLELPPTAAG
jgi:hypothetical protein